MLAVYAVAIKFSRDISVRRRALHLGASDFSPPPAQFADHGLVYAVDQRNIAADFPASSKHLQQTERQSPQVEPCKVVDRRVDAQNALAGERAEKIAAHGVLQLSARDVQHVGE